MLLIILVVLVMITTTFIIATGGAAARDAGRALPGRLRAEERPPGEGVRDIHSSNRIPCSSNVLLYYC